MKMFKEFYHKYDYTIKANFILETIIQTILMIIVMIAIVLIGHDDVNAETLDTSNFDIAGYKNGTLIQTTSSKFSVSALGLRFNEKQMYHHSTTQVLYNFDDTMVLSLNNSINYEVSSSFIFWTPQNYFLTAVVADGNYCDFNLYNESSRYMIVSCKSTLKDNITFTFSGNDVSRNFDSLRITDISFEKSSETLQKETNDKLDDAEKTRKGILQTIIDLPKTIANLFIDMLKSLFIPTEEQMQDILDKSSDLASNFGFIGQSVDFMISLINSLIQSEQGRGCIDLPELTLEFSKSSLDMNDFTVWHEQNICLVDHAWIGDTKIITPIRTLLTGSLVILFLRFAIREFGFILSKENSNYESGDDKE